MLSWIMSAIQSAGYPALALLMLVENLFPPIPSELIMPLAGYLAGRGELSLAWVIVAGTVGSVLGALPLYWLGAKLGADRLVEWADAHGRWLTVSGEDLERARRWFDDHGKRSVFLGRLVPGLRSLIALPAGAARMPMVPFLLSTTAGAALWSAALAVAGYLLGSRFETVSKVLDPVGWVVLGGLVAWYVWRVATHKGKAGGKKKGGRRPKRTARRSRA